MEYGPSMGDCERCAAFGGHVRYHGSFGNRDTKENLPMADLSITVNGMKFPNPFVIGSGLPGRTRR